MHVRHKNRSTDLMIFMGNEFLVGDNRKRLFILDRQEYSSPAVGTGPSPHLVCVYPVTRVVFVPDGHSPTN